MKQTFKLGTIGGVPVGLNWSVVVTVILVADILAQSVLPGADPSAPAGARWAAALVTAALFLGSLAAHEFAHALVARRHGVRVDSVTLWMLGGVAELEGEPPTARADLRIAAVGPATSGAMAAAFAAVWAAAAALGAPPLATTPLAWLAVTNAAIAVFNLLPGTPLDGGRILRGLLWRRRGDRVGAAHAADRAGLAMGRAMIGGGLAALLVGGWFDGLWLALVGWFITSSAKAEDRWTDLREAAGGRRVADIMTSHPDHGWTWQTAGAFIDTVAVASRQAVFPVVDTEGDPVGVVTVERLMRLPAEDAGVALGTLTVPLQAGRVVGPDEPASAVLAHAPFMGDLIAVVVADHHLLGIVTTADVQMLIRRSRLRPTTSAAAGRAA
ncbi:site-2 protease family protein [Actinomadura nitritigenes]|uniref:Zinc metalloprotease n=1 Tax=Actinomadura nitritigenes TaxID=134602 RepID=A0ABS3RB61_9ACTN|nr:site-2 protease family protein [Actinomadura nitritigenes]MBO2443470.1 site-2 protease family protein [Actinomadura nitritigenes]